MLPAEQPSADPAPRRLSVFEIVALGLELLREVDDRDGELDDDLARRLDEHMGTLESKAEAYKAICLTLEEEAEACDRFAHRYATLAKRKRAHVARLKSRLFDAMQALGVTKALGPTGGAALQKSPASVELLVPEHEAGQHIPPEYLETRVHIRKDAIKAALQGGASFAWARLTSSLHLRFR